MRVFLALALLLPATALACPPGMTAATLAEAYFGLNVRGRGPVTPAEWGAFVDEVVTPAFPDGLTVLDGYGQWRNAAGAIAREPSKVLVVALPGADAATAATRLAPVTAAYRQRFAQQSVMVTTRDACLGF